MYKEMGRAFESLDTWSVYMLTSNEQFEEAYGRKATKKRKLFNGFIKTDYYQYWAKVRPQRKKPQQRRRLKQRLLRHLYVLFCHYQRCAFALLRKIMLVWDISVWPFTCDLERFGRVQL